MTSEAAATIEVRDMQLRARIGHYPDDSVAPRQHLLDMTLGVATDRVHVAQDDMGAVFDYDPLLDRIGRIAGARHYVTQEFLLTRIAQLVAETPGISFCRLYIRKSPGPSGAGAVGVQVKLTSQDLEAIRAAGDHA